MIELYCKEKGSGEPLLLLHGNGEDHAYFEHQMDAFAAHYQVIAPDTRGHGCSPRGSAPFTLQTFVNDLAAFIEARGFSTVRIVGFSDGANIALLYALQHAEKVQALVLNGGNLTPKGVKRSVQIPIEWGYAMTKRLARWSKRAAQNRDLLGLMVNEPQIELEALNHLDLPVLVVAGTRDMILEAHTSAMANALPNSRLCLLEGNHFVAHKSSKAFNEAVLSFLLDH